MIHISRDTLFTVGSTVVCVLALRMSQRLLRQFIIEMMIEFLGLPPLLVTLVHWVILPTVFASVGLILKSLYRASKFDDAHLLFLSNDSMVKLKLWLAWWSGRSLEFDMFRPVRPAGNTPSASWTTQNGKITLTTQTKTEVFPSLNVANGIVSLDWINAGQYRATTTRIDDMTCRFVLVPLEPFSSFEVNVNMFEDRIPEFAVRREVVGNETATFLCRQGFYETSQFTNRCWETILNAMAVANKETTAYSVGTIVDKFYENPTKDQIIEIQALAACFWNTNKLQKQPIQRPAHIAKIQFVGDDRDDALAPYKPTGRTVLPFLSVKPNSSPMKGYQSDLAAVHYRIDMVRNTVASLSAKAREYIDEFVDLVAPAPIRPWTLEAVIEHQDGPLQRLRNERVKWFMDTLTAKVKAMIKVEPVANDGPVRNISTLPAEYNLANGRYMLAAAEWLKKNTEWYTAGKTPTAVAERITTLASEAMRAAGNPGAAKLCCADVSKMDAGKHPYIQAWLTSRIYARMFTHDCDELLSIREKEAMATATTDGGVSYEIGATQLSGSACTTIDNTITNAFLSYAAHRIEGLTPQESYQKLGAYVGDDSVSHNSALAMEAAGQLFGYTIKAEMVSYGEHVPFLSRMFYAVWHGEPVSFQDPNRLMAKAHLTYAPPQFSDLEAATNKFRGYSELDPGVRVYRHIFEKLKELGGDTGRRWSGDTPYNLQQGENWPTCGESQNIWTGITGTTVQQYVHWLKNVDSYEQLLKSSPPLVLNDAKNKDTITIDPQEPGSVPPIPIHKIPEEATVAVPRNHPGATAARSRAEAARDETRSMAKDEKRKKKATVRAEKQARVPGKPPSLFEIGEWKPKSGLKKSARTDST